MKTREKLAYMALGGVLVIAGMVLSDFTSVANAQLEGLLGNEIVKDLIGELSKGGASRKKMIQADTIMCKRIILMDKKVVRGFIGRYTDPKSEVKWAIDLRDEDQNFLVGLQVQNEGRGAVGQIEAYNHLGDKVLSMGSRSSYSGDQKGDGYIRIYDKNRSTLFEK